MTQYGIVEFSPERKEWRVFLPERANMKPLSRGSSAGPTEADLQDAADFLRISGFRLSAAGWQQDDRRWVIVVEPR